MHICDACNLRLDKKKTNAPANIIFAIASPLPLRVVSHELSYDTVVKSQYSDDRKCDRIIVIG